MKKSVINLTQSWGTRRGSTWSRAWSIWNDRNVQRTEHAGCTDSGATPAETANHTFRCPEVSGNVSILTFRMVHIKWERLFGYHEESDEIWTDQ